MSTVDPNDRILHHLGERVKELTALHRTARILQNDDWPVAEAIPAVVALLPGAWQYPEITSARVVIGTEEFTTPGFAESAWMQSATFTTRPGETGRIDIAYREKRPDEIEGPFLAEERDLIESLAEMLRSYLQHKIADQKLQEAHDNLEEQVRRRTAELRESNRALQEQIEQYRQAQEKITQYQRQLQRLAAELSLAEERHRHEIATDLHDHIGQALAFTKMRLTELQGNAVFSGLDADFGSVVDLLDQTIRYTRSLTFQISPPVLYELGLPAAIEWLCEQARERYKFAVETSIADNLGAIPDELRIVLFRAVQELLMNAAKYAEAGTVQIAAKRMADGLTVEVRDDGIGFDTTAVETPAANRAGFGLFSIRERLRFLGGDMRVESSPGAGARIVLQAPSGPKGAADAD